MQRERLHGYLFLKPSALENRDPPTERGIFSPRKLFAPRRPSTLNPVVPRYVTRWQYLTSSVLFYVCLRWRSFSINWYHFSAHISCLFVNSSFYICWTWCSAPGLQHLWAVRTLQIGEWGPLGTFQHFPYSHSFFSNYSYMYGLPHTRWVPPDFTDLFTGLFCLCFPRIILWSSELEKAESRKGTPICSGSRLNITEGIWQPLKVQDANITLKLGQD